MTTQETMKDKELKTKIAFNAATAPKTEEEKKEQNAREYEARQERIVD